MNREILFRGKRTSNLEWVYGNLFQVGDTSFILKITDRALDYPEKVLVDTETVGQFTGLTDKNGVKIFEGDITNNKNWNPQNYEVIFDQGEFCFTTEDLKPYTNSLHYLQDFEVIGNIHDNPELLER